MRYMRYMRYIYMRIYIHISHLFVVLLLMTLNK